VSIFCGLEGLDVVVWLRFSERFGDGVFPLVLFLQICKRVRIAMRGRSYGNLSKVRIAKPLGIWLVLGLILLVRRQIAFFRRVSRLLCVNPLEMEN